MIATTTTQALSQFFKSIQVLDQQISRLKTEASTVRAIEALREAEEKTEELVDLYDTLTAELEGLEV